MVSHPTENIKSSTSSLTKTDSVHWPPLFSNVKKHDYIHLCSITKYTNEAHKAKSDIGPPSEIHRWELVNNAMTLPMTSVSCRPDFSREKTCASTPYRHHYFPFLLTILLRLHRVFSMISQLFSAFDLGIHFQQLGIKVYLPFTRDTVLLCCC